LLHNAVNKRRRHELEAIHVEVTRAGLGVVTEDRELLALERSRVPVVCDLELAAQLRPVAPIGAGEHASFVVDKIHAQPQKNSRVCDQRMSSGLWSHCHCRLNVGEEKSSEVAIE
jgi:hypothetical protein